MKYENITPDALIHASVKLIDCFGHRLYEDLKGITKNVPVVPIDYLDPLRCVMDETSLKTKRSLERTAELILDTSSVEDVRVPGNVEIGHYATFDFGINGLQTRCRFQDHVDEEKIDRPETFLKAFKAYERAIASRMNKKSIHGDWLAMQEFIANLLFLKDATGFY